MSRIFNRHLLAIGLGAALSASGGVSLADWDPQDGHKMHWPQMPDPNGWDICLNHSIIADDFQCSQTEPITDVHFWVSWQDDITRWDLIQSIDVTFFADAGSHPGNVLRGYSIAPTSPSFSYRLAGSGQQGWHCPSTPYTEPLDHLNFYQINLKPLDEPWFNQTQGGHYWLGLKITMLPDGDADPANDPQIGWKTAMPTDHFGEFSQWRIGQPMPWQYVLPENFVRDQAFVITTPEPGALSLLAMVSVGLVRRRK